MNLIGDALELIQSLKPFQKVTLPILAVLAAYELVVWLRRPLSRRVRFFRSAVWLAAALAIARPNAVQEVATSIGIGRGTDVVLYVFVLAFLGTSFYWYSRQLHLQRQMTELVRHIAIHEARRGGQGLPSIPTSISPSE